MSKDFSHIDDQGNASMVDVSAKSVTARAATAQCTVSLPDEVMKHFADGDLLTAKGSVRQTAILAGVMAAKRTSDLIPLCHPLALEDCQVTIRPVGSQLIVRCTARITGKTGVEMEALTGASVAALTIYDMCKSMSHDIAINDLHLVSKQGGKRDFDRDNQTG